MSKILVTGGAGFIGSHTVELLVKQGHSVVVADNLRTGRRENLASIPAEGRLEFLEIDVADPQALNELVKATEPDVVIHLAALVNVQESIADSELNFRLNVKAVHSLAETVRRHGVSRVVFASSAAIYGNGGQLPLQETRAPAPISPYGAAKAAGEALLFGHAAAFGFSAVCLRYFNVLGPRQRPDSPYSGVVSIFAECSRLNRAPVIFGDGRQTRDFVHVRDIARANLLAATQPLRHSGSFNICSGRETSLLEIIALLKQAQPDLPAPEFRPERVGDIRRSLGDPAQAKTMLGFEAQVDLAESLVELTEKV